MSRLFGMLAALGLAMAPLSAKADASSCKFQIVAQMPVQMEGLRPIVAAKLNGQDVRFLLDTGAFFSGVTDEAAQRLGLKRTAVPMGLMVQGMGGAARDARAVEADTFDVAGATLKHSQFIVVGRVDDGAVGMIGQNVLGAYDMEFDLANGMVRFFKATNCTGVNLAYWSKGLSSSRLDLLNDQHYVQKIAATAKIDGHFVRVVFDSGVATSFINRAAASRAGVTIATEGAQSAGVAHGVFGGGMETFLAPFASFAIGDEEIKNTRLRVAKVDLGDTDMWLGADFFLSHRILVAKSQHRIYFTYNGGPVFRLDRNPGAQVADAAPAAPSSAPAPAVGAEAKTAADFLRRGQAAAARRDFAAAIADFGKAIALEPANAEAYQARARARMATGQGVLAMADLDQALKHDPGNVEALMSRGELYLAARDGARADADFQEAVKRSPGNAMLPAHIGYVYAHARRFEPAIAALDSWIAANPKSENLPQVLTVRCWARAAWGKQLELALADCDAAMKRDRVSQVMEARGLVLLRMGRTDEALAQFAQAVKLQPRSADALYGRGVAELAKGDKAAADADFAAAVAARPGVAAEFQGYGLGPGQPAAAAAVGGPS